MSHLKIDVTNDLAFDPSFTAAGNHGSTRAHSTRNCEELVFVAFAIVRKGSGQAQGTLEVGALPSTAAGGFRGWNRFNSWA